MKNTILFHATRRATGVARQMGCRSSVSTSSGRVSLLNGGFFDTRNLGSATSASS